MKKLNKIPSKEVIRYGDPGGYEFNYGFIFSEELPYKHKRNLVRDEKRKRAKGKLTLSDTVPSDTCPQKG